ncbi:MAG TPA: dihydrofolate reductase [Planctomycetaceae bacterium]|nr:dihydrofolate reductase [Planctomycetaceae bacterium]
MITYFVAASRDGFIAREDGDVSWLDEMDITPEDSGIGEFMSSIDGLIMGRKTYDFVFDYGTWPYGALPTWVFTNNPLESLPGANLKTTASSQDLLQDVQRNELNDLWLVGGGQLASSFLSEGLIDVISISEMPITLGKGIALFARHKLEDIETAQEEIVDKPGFRQRTMHVAKNSPP